MMAYVEKYSYKPAEGDGSQLRRCGSSSPGCAVMVPACGPVPIVAQYLPLWKDGKMWQQQPRTANDGASVWPSAHCSPVFTSLERWEDVAASAGDGE